MKIKRTIVWTLLNTRYHPSVNPDELTYKQCLSVMASLFPGVTFNTKDEFYAIMNQCVIPALARRFGWMIGMDTKKVGKKTFFITPVMGSNRTQCLTDPNWRKGLEKRIAA